MPKQQTPNIDQLKQQYPLVTGEDKQILRTVCPQLKKITPDIKHLGNALLELMREHDGVGLAAPQVGHLIRMAAVSQRDTSGRDSSGKTKRELLDEFVMINPNILARSEYTSTESEACLSLPGLKGNVSRPKKITLQYLGLDGKTHIHKASGFNARVILHELDHLDGVLFIDKLA